MSNRPNLSRAPRVKQDPSTGNHDVPLDVEYLAEHNLILCLLEKPEIIDELQPDLFADPQAIACFEWASERRQRREDAKGFAENMAALSHSAYGMFMIVMRWVQDPDTLRCPSAWQFWAGICQEKAARRRTLSALEAYKAGDVGLGESIALLRGIETQAHRRGTPTKASQIEEAISDMEQRYESNQSFMGVDTGWPTLNACTDGLTPKALWVVAARPSVGKTTWACNLASQVGVTLSLPTAFFSLEMSTRLVYQKLWHIRGNVSQSARKRQQLSQVDFAKLTQAAAETKAAPLMVIDDSRTLQSISADIRRMKDENGLRVVVIDYLQRVTIEGSKEDRWHDIGRVSNSLKDIAMDTGTTVVALAQLNRDVEKEGREPNLADLRGSAEIEADADVIAFLWRKEDALQFTIGKSRMGITSPVPIQADYDTGRMIEHKEMP